MEKASVSSLKNRLSAYLRKVRAGQSVVIYDRNVPIARLERIENGGSNTDRMNKLRAQGLTRPASRALTEKQIRTLGEPLTGKARLQEALDEDRKEGR